MENTELLVDGGKFVRIPKNMPTAEAVKYITHGPEMEELLRCIVDPHVPELNSHIDVNLLIRDDIPALLTKLEAK